MEKEKKTCLCSIMKGTSFNAATKSEKNLTRERERERERERGDKKERKRGKKIDSIKVERRKIKCG